MNADSFAIVVYLTSEENRRIAILQCQRIRLFSLGKIVLMVSPDIILDRDLISVSDDIERVDSLWGMYRLIQYSKVLYLPLLAKVGAQIDTLFLYKMPALSSDGILLVEPSLFVYALLSKAGIDTDIVQFYQQYGYTWTQMKSIKADDRETDERSRRFKNHLLSIFIPLLGERSREVLNKYITLYEQAFTTKKMNPAFNYELLEAYGDRFLAGQYAWLMIKTPGIITADQVTKIGSFFQNRYALNKVCNRLRLSEYILTAPDEPNDLDTRADVIESLIAAIGISWQNMYKKGDEAMRVFISKVWRSIFTIEPEKYRILYEEPAAKFKELVEQLQANRSLISISDPQESGDELLVTLMYNKYPIGIGRVSTQGLYKDTAIRAARRAAYIDALNNNTLEKYLSRSVK